jgi:hypothetical protein
MRHVPTSANTELSDPTAATKSFLLRRQLKIIATYRNADLAFSAELVALFVGNPPYSLFVTTT